MSETSDLPAEWISYDPYGGEPRMSIDGGPFFPIKSFSLNREDLASHGFYEWATAAAPERPLMLAEWGFDLTSRAYERLMRALGLVTPTARSGLALLQRHRRRRHR